VSRRSEHREAPNIDRFLWVLDTIVTLAPLLGLFGTIVGMFNAFKVLSNPGNAPTQVTGGVAEALVATASGLFVAMIGLVFFNGLHNRVRGVVHQLETVKAALVNRLAARTHEPLKTMHEVPRPVVGKFASQGA
jgi:biopolymer transport protein ExbB